MAETVPHYAWRARTYPWAQRTIAAAEAIHGPPGTEWDSARRRQQFAELRDADIPVKAAARAIGVSIHAGQKYETDRKAQAAAQSVPEPARHEKPRCDRCGYLVTRCCCQEVTRG
jgi:hypothetical protein